MINRNERNERNERNDRRCRMAANLAPAIPQQNGTGTCCGGCDQVPAMPSAACKNLLSRLQTLDFSIVDTVLYLDAYPECREALAHYHKLLSERDALLLELSEKCRMPMTNFSNASHDAWDWTRGPWPWETNAN